MFYRGLVRIRLCISVLCFAEVANSELSKTSEMKQQTREVATMWTLTESVERSRTRDPNKQMVNGIKRARMTLRDDWTVGAWKNSKVGAYI